MDCLLKAEELTKCFGPKRAVSGVTLSLTRGEVLGFLGPNGAGKSTTMKMLTGYLAPTSGRAEVCGQDVSAGDHSARAKIGYLPEGAPLYGDMTTVDFLKFIGRAHGLENAKRREAVEGAVDALQLASVRYQRIETLSKGFKRRVGLAAAILHDPDVLILDEPTDGLDPNQKHQVRALIQAMAPDRAIIISTHILEEVEALCTRAVVIADGEVVADSTPAELKARSAYAGAVSVTVDQAVIPELVEKFAGLDGVDKLEQSADGPYAKLTVKPKPGADLVGSVGDIIGSAGWTVHAYGVETGRLDDVFRTLTKGGLA